MYPVFSLPIGENGQIICSPLHGDCLCKRVFGQFLAPLLKEELKNLQRDPLGRVRLTQRSRKSEDYIICSKCNKVSALKALVHTSHMETRPPKKGEAGGSCLVSESSEENNGVTHLCIDHQNGKGNRNKPVFSLQIETPCFWDRSTCSILHPCSLEQ